LRLLSPAVELLQEAMLLEIGNRSRDLTRAGRLPAIYYMYLPKITRIPINVAINEGERIGSYIQIPGHSRVPIEPINHAFLLPQK
jgi:hypothetical protein